MQLFAGVMIMIAAVVMVNINYFENSRGRYWLLLIACLLFVAGTVQVLAGL